MDFFFHLFWPEQNCKNYIAIIIWHAQFFMIAIKLTQKCYLAIWSTIVGVIYRLSQHCEIHLNFGIVNNIGFKNKNNLSNSNSLLIKFMKTSKIKISGKELKIFLLNFHV